MSSERIQPTTPNSAVLAELGSRLARVRKQRGVTQEELAREAGVGVATLRRIEDGRDSRLGSWIRVLRALDMTAALDALLPRDFRSPLADARKEGLRRKWRGDEGATGGFIWGDGRP